MFSIISPLCVLSDSLFDVTKLFYEDLKQGMLEEDELIIIDNDSSIGQQEFSKIADTYIHLHKNLGYGGALNLGSKLAKGEFLVFPNNDIRIDATWRQKMLDSYNTYLKVAVVSYRMDEMIPATGTPFTGIFWSIRSKIFKESTGFNEKYNLGREQDTDFLYRMLKQGYDIDAVYFDLKHTRRSTYNQPEFRRRYDNNLNFGDSPFEKIHGFHHNNWYREGIKNRI